MRQKTIMQGKIGMRSAREESAAQKVVVHALQKQIELVNLKEWIIMGAFIGGAALLRVPMQAIPSAEPITFFAILAGLLFGSWRGAVVGASSLYLSNFLVFGGQGPWSIFQAIGFGAAGVFGGMIRHRVNWFTCITIGVVASVVFEVIMNLSSLFVFPSILGVFLSALPFSLMHISTSAVFSLLLPKAKKLTEHSGGFDEKQAALQLLSKLQPEKSVVGKKITGRVKVWLSLFRDR